MDTDKKMHGLVDALVHTPVLTIEARATLRSAARALREGDVGTLAVMDGPEVAAIVSERDVVRALAEGADPDQVQVAEVMTEYPRYLTSGEEVASAMEVMLAAGVRHLPVLDEGEVVGIVSMRDLVGVLAS